MNTIDLRLLAVFDEIYKTVSPKSVPCVFP